MHTILLCFCAVQPPEAMQAQLLSVAAALNVTHEKAAVAAVEQPLLLLLPPQELRERMEVLARALEVGSQGPMDRHWMRGGWESRGWLDRCLCLVGLPNNGVPFRKIGQSGGWATEGGRLHASLRGVVWCVLHGCKAAL